MRIFLCFDRYSVILLRIIAKETNVTKQGKNTLNVVASLVLGGAILYWMYRGFDFGRVREVLLHEMSWTWMLLSFPFGVLAQAFRGWRWRQTLEPLGEQSRASVRVHSIFLSYAASLVIPRIGEFARCGVLHQKDGVSFPKALGTVVTERAIDSLLVLAIAALTFVTQFRVFMTFFEETGTSLDAIFHRFTTTGWVVTIVCLVAIVGVGWFLIKKAPSTPPEPPYPPKWGREAILPPHPSTHSVVEETASKHHSSHTSLIYNKVKESLAGIWQGVMSLKNVKNIPLFIFYTLAIWGCYFLHYYLTFFCFDATAGLGMSCALVTFIVGSIAVIVPTPNGAGPWHFAVKTMLILYGVGETDALYFVLIVHSVQTLLVVALGVYAWVALSIKRRVERGEWREESGERL